MELGKYSYVHRVENLNNEIDYRSGDMGDGVRGRKGVRCVCYEVTRP
jgi:hypothetical protein